MLQPKFGAVGYLPEIRHDFTQWSAEQIDVSLKLYLYDCLKRESPLYAVFAAGLQEAYSHLKSPLDSLSYVHPLITVAYLFIAARFFMGAVGHRKALVFGMVSLAALVATGANALSAWAYLSHNSKNSTCREQLAEGLGPGRTPTWS